MGPGALVGRALMGRALMGPLGPYGPGPYGPGPYGPPWALMGPALNLINSIDFPWNYINIHSAKVLANLPAGIMSATRAALAASQRH